MAKLIWFNQPTNHSGWINFFYLMPNGDVGKFDIYTADSGCYLLGGPVLTYDGFEWMDSAMTLMSFLPAGFHFFPSSTADEIRQFVEKNRAMISDNSHALDPDESYYELNVYSNAYTTTQCCDMLLNGTTPESAVVFVNQYESGHVPLAVELARIYYGLSSEQREELGLEVDWDHSWSD